MPFAHVADFFTPHLLIVVKGMLEMVRIKWRK